MLNKNLYLITIRLSTGHMVNKAVVASTRALAETEACNLCGVPIGTEPHTTQLLHAVDSIAD